MPAFEAPETVTSDLLLLGAPTHNGGLPSPRSREQALLTVHRAKGLEPSPRSREQAVARGATEVPPTGIKEWLSRADLTSVLKVAVFETVVDGLWVGSAARAPKKAVAGRKRVRVEQHRFVVSGKVPALKDDQTESARAWGMAMAREA